MTRERTNALGEGRIFGDLKEVSVAYYSKQIDLQARVKVRINEVNFNDLGEAESKKYIVDTTVGSALLWDVVPDGLSYDMVNQPMTKKAISRIINRCYRDVGLKATVIFADQLMYTGFDFSTKSGASIWVNDFTIPSSKEKIIAQSEEEVKELSLIHI